MSLLAIKAFLNKPEGVSLAELCFHFSYEPETLRAMLSLWVRKGKVRCWQRTSKCGSQCHSCSFAATELYRWEA